MMCALEKILPLHAENKRQLAQLVIVNELSFYRFIGERTLENFLVNIKVESIVFMRRQYLYKLAATKLREDTFWKHFISYFLRVTAAAAGIM